MTSSPDARIRTQAQRRQRRPPLWAVGIVNLSILVAPAVAEAGLKVGPSRVTLQAHPGEVLTGFFVLENNGTSPIQVSVEPEDWSEGIHGERGPVSWMTVRPKRLTVKPDRPAKVKYKIRVPKEVSGELRTQVFFTSQAAGGVSLRSRLGVIVYVVIEGTERFEVVITKVRPFYTASTPEVASPDRLEVVIGVRNQGNTHIVPKGRVVVHDSEGRAVATVRLQSGWGLLPNEEDTYRAIGHGIHLKPGRHVFEVTIVLGDDLGQPNSVTRTFEAMMTEEGHIRLVE